MWAYLCCENYLRKSNDYIQKLFCRYLSVSCSYLAMLPLVLATPILVQAGSCPLLEGPGYQGITLATSGNCDVSVLPPLSAFGSNMINQTPSLLPNNRLNPSQFPRTNNFQRLQLTCSILQNNWSNSDFPKAIPLQGTKVGPFFVGMARTGPVVVNFPFYINSGTTLPSINYNGEGPIYFSAAEVNKNDPNSDYFDVTTKIINSETCQITYVPRNKTSGQIIDYLVTGNVFHDVYYEDLTPVLATQRPLVFAANSIPVIIDDQNNSTVQTIPVGQTITGRKFQFFFQTLGTLAPQTVLIYVENADQSPITIKVISDNTDRIFFTAQEKYTGFIRIASISSQDNTIVTNTSWQNQPWSQTTYFNPTNDVISTPTPTCAVEDPSCSVAIAGPNSTQWWLSGIVQTTSATGLNFYMLFPTAWTAKYYSLGFKQMGANWQPPPANPINYPSPDGMSPALPVFALENYAQANTWYNDVFNYLKSISNPTMPCPCCVPPCSSSDYSKCKIFGAQISKASNYFLLQFDMLMASNSKPAINTFQGASRQLANYQITSPNNSLVYDQHRRYIPVKADVVINSDSSLTWTYTLDSTVSPSNPADNKVLICFPFWKFLQGSTPNVVNTAPSAGEPLQNFIFNDIIKGTLYAAEAINGTVTFLENPLPDWYVNPSGTYPSLFIPPSLPLDPSTLDNILNHVLPCLEPGPFPYVPESYFGDAYDAGKTIFAIAKSALSISYLLALEGKTPAQIVQATESYVNYAKSFLYTFIVQRNWEFNYFVADQSTPGICVNGTSDGSNPGGPNLQIFYETGKDFQNFFYNDHHFLSSYFLLAAAMITEWELNYKGLTGTQLWIELPVLGADYKPYKLRNFFDFLWRDVHNPFTNDPEFPYDRINNLWEGHGTANGIAFGGNKGSDGAIWTLGKNEESICEDYNCWIAINSYSRLILKNSSVLSGAEAAIYQRVRDYSYMNLKLVASAASVLWYKSDTYWIKDIIPTSTAPVMYNGNYTQRVVNTGNINDSAVQSQTFF